MTIENFTPLPAVIGGVLIGLASVWLLVANGRIAGVSGILHGLFAEPAGSAPGARAGDRLWRAWFIAGLVVAGFAWHAFADPAPLRQGFGLGWVALAGLLVGFGTRMSGGCTNGPGVHAVAAAGPAPRGPGLLHRVARHRDPPVVRPPRPGPVLCPSPSAL